MYDLVIENAFIFDGRGNPGFAGALAIRDGRIAAIEKKIDGVAAARIDAGGKWLCPGFIDIHTHYDLEVEIAPGLSESVRHGVTSIVMGNCSLSVTMGKPEDLGDIFQRVETLPRELIQSWLKSAAHWKSSAEYLEHLRTLNVGPNVAALLGHSALRTHVMGLRRSLTEQPTPAELLEMRALADKALSDGCIGISIDMVPWHMMSGGYKNCTIPSSHAFYREFSMLADVCRKHDAVFQATPNPQRPFTVLQILMLSVGIFRRPLRLTVLSALDTVEVRRLWRMFPFVLWIFNGLLRSNIRFQTLTEAFTVYADGAITPVFEEFPAGIELNDCESREERQQLWKSKAFRARFEKQWKRTRYRTFHRNLEGMDIVACPDSSLVGKSMASLGKGDEALQRFMELLEKYDTDLRWVSTGANDREEIREKLLTHPHILPGFTDAGAHARNLGYYDGAVSLIRKAWTRKFMSVERAIQRMTSEPAEWFHLDCGTLKKGAKADLVIINPAGLTDEISPQVECVDASLQGAIRLVKRGSGNIVHAVFINGEKVVSDGEPLPVLGKVQTGVLMRPVSASISSRNRISDDIADHPFSEYWDIFVLKHQNRANVMFHMVGYLLFYGLVVLAAVERNPRILFLLPSSQLVGLLGHWLFERSHVDTQDAVFSRRASRCLNIMFWKVVTGKYFDEVRRNKMRLEAYHQEKDHAQAR